MTKLGSEVNHNKANNQTNAKTTLEQHCKIKGLPNIQAAEDLSLDRIVINSSETMATQQVRRSCRSARLRTIVFLFMDSFRAIFVYPFFKCQNEMMRWLLCKRIDAWICATCLHCNPNLTLQIASMGLQAMLIIVLIGTCASACMYTQMDFPYCIGICAGTAQTITTEKSGELSTQALFTL